MATDDSSYICLFLICEIHMQQKGDWVKSHKMLAVWGRHVKLMLWSRTAQTSYHNISSPHENPLGLVNFILWDRRNLRER